VPREKGLFALVARVILIFASSTLLAPTLAAGQEQVLHIFNGSDGANSFSGLVFDAAGNLYGTTQQGGNTGYGTVFKLTRRSNGTWAETVLHNFHGPDGLDPGGLAPSAALVFDRAGNLFGTTFSGGVHGAGVVFELSPGAGGKWTETVLHAFNNEVSGEGQPAAPLIFDKAGNLYGTTTGVPPGKGTVFKLSPNSNGTWTETVLHTFSGEDGAKPYGGLIFDAAGNLYGTTNVGGANKYFGNVFELAPGGGGEWKETVLHTFSSQNGDGAYPQAGLLLDAAGNLYGTTSFGGLPDCAFGCGIAFKLTPGANGKWRETILYEFTGGADGAYPGAAFTPDASGNLYSTTASGGNPLCTVGCGVVFELAEGASGKWSETVLNAFDGYDGSDLWSNVILDGAGNLYGTTADGGNNGNGVVYEVTQ